MAICSSIAVFLHCYAFAGLLFPIASSPISDLVCHFVNCGQGNCTESKGTLLPFDCDCNFGWKKMQMGSVDLPPCVVPNCDLDLGCGSHASSPIDVPPLSSFNVTNPIYTCPACSYTYCGDGTCLAKDETSHQCSCNMGSTNLLSLTSLPCLRQCALQRDCQAIRSSDSRSPQTPPLPSSTIPRTPFFSSPCGENCTIEYNFSEMNQTPGLILLIFIFILHV